LVANNTFLAQAKHNPERGELLVEQRRGLWDFPQSNRLQIEVEQKVEQSLAPPFFISVSIAAKYRDLVCDLRSSTAKRRSSKPAGMSQLGLLATNNRMKFRILIGSFPLYSMKRKSPVIKSLILPSAA
jgi:hypothetical protein